MKRFLSLSKYLPLVALLIMVATMLVPAQAHHETAARTISATPAAGTWTLLKFPQPAPACTGVAYSGITYFETIDCGFGYVTVSETTDTSTVVVELVDSTDTVVDTVTTTYRDDDIAWEFDITPTSSWTPGLITARVSSVTNSGESAQTGNFGQTTFFVNQLGATVSAAASSYAPGDPIVLSGLIFKQDQINSGLPVNTNVAASFFVEVVRADGTVHWTSAEQTASAGPLDTGTIDVTLPAAATEGILPSAEMNFAETIALRIVDASYTDPVSGAWVADDAAAASVSIVVEPTDTGAPSDLVLENKFVSSVGWVKPNETYPFRVLVKNFGASADSNVIVTLNDVDGMIYTQVTESVGTATISGDGTTLTWNIPTIGGAVNGSPTIATLVVEAKADSLTEDPQIVWKDLSSTATLNSDGATGAQTSMTHGPKVIPQDNAYNSARFGDRPFPVVPVDWFDRKHDAATTGDAIDAKINSPSVPGSTFNLFQEISLGQLFPSGAVPASDIASADFNVTWNGYYADKGWQFRDVVANGACNGVTLKDTIGTPIYGERIVNGWYQMPGDTNFYGADKNTFVGSIGGASAGVGALLSIDDACGPTGKAVYDAAHIADPEIDYNDFDTDKDGVVDFFMMLFVGCGGNGSSQLGLVGCPSGNGVPYDNIWPHSSSLEFYYTDDATGLTGYISDDQLKSLTGVPQCWVDANYTVFDDCAANGGSGLNSLPTYVRVGPYNVNPEDSIANASVISHEYGHSLGLPDFYSLGSRETYGDWNLMATDKGHHMDVFSKQEMGWIVPQPITDNMDVTDWQDSKVDTGEIHWQQPDGTPYTLSAANGDQNVHNAEAYVAKLPARQLIDPQKVIDGTDTSKGQHVWWSGSGNDFNCPPSQGHNLDIFLPELANLDAGSTVEVRFQSYFDIEWDFDYGFVLVSEDGANYTSVPSAEGYTTATSNPNQNACQGTFGNGLTGTSGSFDAGTDVTDRLLGEYPDGGFIPDRYDISSMVGKQTVLRFAYATDPGLARPGWFIDDLEVVVLDGNGDVTRTIYSSDFEESDEERIVNGGCAAHARTADVCTTGWVYVSADAGSPADHAYYLEMRDRSSFDIDGKGENDRDAINFSPGLLLVYTDESHGYGNTGADNQPAQTPVDANPQIGNEAPNLDDAAFTAAGQSTYSDHGSGYIDNYDDGSGQWLHQFDCLSFEVTSMSGTDIGPLNPPYNLTGDVSFDLGDGCIPFAYGLGNVQNNPPTPLIQVRERVVNANSEVRFDGSGTTDDHSARGNMLFQWDFDNDGTVDATGENAVHTFTSGGIKTVKLTVTDEGGLFNSATIDMTVIGGRANVPTKSASSTQSTNTQSTRTIQVENTGFADLAYNVTEADSIGGRSSFATLDTIIDPAGVDTGATRAMMFDRLENAPRDASRGTNNTRGAGFTACDNGMAGDYPCSGIDMMSHLPLTEIGGGDGNDIWGWTDSASGREFALMGRSSGTSFVEITDPSNPIYLANLPTQTLSSSWRDIKVVNDHAVVVSEAVGHGMQIYDLSNLLTLDPNSAPHELSTDPLFGDITWYSDFGSAHNVVVNDDTNYAYAVGTADTDLCSGGLHIVNMADPSNPVNEGCFADDGYTHDAQCVVYAGPDTEHQGKEICFNSNEDTLTIVDMSNKANPIELSRVGYPNAEYTHQGWLNDDQSRFVMNDELDEQRNGNNTRSLIWDVEDLDLPEMKGVFLSATPAIDHNNYFKDGKYYQANYRAGLRILDASDVTNFNLTEIAYFDVYPADDNAEFNGAWSNYPYFPSGNIIISGIEQGLFVVREQSLLEKCNDPTAIDWLSVSPLSGTVAASQVENLTVTFDSTGKSEGDYTATVCVNTDDTANPRFAVPVTMTVTTVPLAVSTVTQDAAPALNLLIPTLLLAAGLGTLIVVKRREE